MERLTVRDSRQHAWFNNDGVLIRGANGTFHQKKDMTAHYIHDRFVALDKVIDRLAAYEDTGLTPKEVETFKERVKVFSELLVDISCGCTVTFGRLAKLAQAEKDGRLVVLDEPRKPLLWGDDAHDSVLCPNCNHDLMGGFQEDEYCEKDMYQCPYCGQSIDGTKALTREEAEAALKKREAWATQ